MRKLLALLFAISIFFTLFVGQSYALNPFVTHIYTADPSAHVFENRVYVYPSHDQDHPNWFNMVDYHVFSSGDLKNWVDHGVVLHLNQVPWENPTAKKWMWAPDCAYKGGMYYFYYCASTSSESSQQNMVKKDFKIGVATSKSPMGPFVPEPNPIAGTDSIDPCVFIDDADGQAYLFYGGQGHGGVDHPKWAKLKSNMKEIDGSINDIESGVDYWFEACWVFKRKNLYYLAYSTGSNGGGQSKIHYSTSTSIEGPWKHQGELLGEVPGWTNHISIVDYPKDSNNWYIFYHTSEMSSGTDNKISERSICADRLTFDKEGLINKVTPTRVGLGTSAYQTIKAQFYSAQSGTDLEDYTNGVGRCVNWIENGDWLSFDKVDFEDSQSCARFEATVASNTEGGTIEVRDGSKTGQLIASVNVPNTGGWQKWKTVSTDIHYNSRYIGHEHNIYLVFTGGSGALFNLDSFKFTRKSSSEIPVGLNVSLRSKYNDQYLCADQNKGTPPTIYANRSEAGWWERFEVINEGMNKQMVALKSANNGCIVTPYASGALVKANQDSSDLSYASWYWVRNSDGTISLKDVLTDKYAAVGSGSRVYANQSSINEKGKFYVEVTDAPIGCTVVFKSLNNNNYLVTEIKTGTPQLVCASGSENVLSQNSTISKFIIEDAGNGYVALKSKYNNQYLRVNSSSEKYVIKNNGGSTVDHDRERFQWVNNGDGTVGLMCVYNSQYVCADSNASELYHPSIHANRSGVNGDWERFICILQ